MPVYGTVLKVTVAAPGTVAVKMTVGANKEAYVLEFKDGETEGRQLVSDKPAAKGSYEYSFSAEPGYTYYVYVKSSKAVFGTVKFTPPVSE